MFFLLSCISVYLLFSVVFQGGTVVVNDYYCSKGDRVLCMVFSANLSKLSGLDVL